MAIQVTFQLDSPRERADVSKCISAMEASQNPYGNRQTQVLSGRQTSDIQEYSSKIKELEKSNKDLQDDIERYRKQTERDAKTIEKLQQEKDVLIKENEAKIKEAEEAMKLAEEADEKTSKVSSEFEQRLQKQTAQFNEIIKNRNAEHEDAVRRLNDRIAELQKQLEIYNPSINMRTSSETTYYRVEGNMLVETNSTDAEYMAQNMGDKNYRFQFNFEKGPVREACANREVMLFPFCDIIEDSENASIIRPDDWGTAVMTGGDLKIETKAKIRLSRD